MTIEPKDPQSNEFQIMDRKDENQIIQEMQGETALLEEYVYSFRQGNRQVTSLSYAGIKEMVRRRGDYEIVSVEKEETDKTIRIIVKIRDMRSRVDFLGASETEKDKPFAYVLAVNKAERNAYRKAMPAEFLAKMVDAFLHGKTERPIEPAPQPTTSTPEKPAAANDDAPLFYRVQAEIPPHLQGDVYVEESDGKLLLKTRKRLETQDFKAICQLSEAYHGQWSHEQQAWVIPQ